MKWTLVLVVLVGVAALVASEQYDDERLYDDNNGSSVETNTSDESDEIDQGARVARSPRARGQRQGNKGKNCRYTKGPWSECDTATNQRSRSLTLKKGDSTCEASKTITKKCKNAKKGGRRNRD